MGEAHYQTGNSLFVDELFEDALVEYNKAISENASNPEYFSKRSFCHCKLKNYTSNLKPLLDSPHIPSSSSHKKANYQKESVEDAQNAINLDPQNALAHLRKGMALFYLEEYETARSTLEKGAAIDSSNRQFSTWIRKCNAEIEEETPAATLSNSSTVPSYPSPTLVSSSSSSAYPPVRTPVMPPMPSDVQPPSAPLPSKIRHEWFQSNSHVIVTIFAKGLKREDADIEFNPQRLKVLIKLGDSREYSLDLDLCDQITPEESDFVIMSTKIEIKLKKKVENTKWAGLEKPDDPNTITTLKWDDSSQVNKHQYPSSSKSKKDWNKIQEEEEKLSGDAALNKVFQDIFSRGSEDQRRAMMKSFVESGGTVLSTNWQDIGSRKVEVSPPKGLEAHSWDELQKGK